MRCRPRILLTGFVLLCLVSSGSAGSEKWSETDGVMQEREFALVSGTSAKDRSAKSPPLILRDCKVRNFSETPPVRHVDFTPNLKDSATTSDRAVNYREVMEYLGIELSDVQKRFLDENKFLLIPQQSIDPTLSKRADDDTGNKSWDEMITLFDMIGGGDQLWRQPQNARFVNPDIVLHAFHKFFENSLKYLEKHELAILLRGFLEGIQAKALERKRRSGADLAARYEIIAAQLTVPLILMENATWKEAVDGNEATIDAPATLEGAEGLLSKFAKDFSPKILKDIKTELELIHQAQGVRISPLFGHYSKDRAVKTDYTQFKPRGHYESHSILRAYFLAMMYLGRNSYLLGTEQGISDAVLVACLLADHGKDGRSFLDDWQKIMEITSFYAGQPDDIIYPEWRNFLTKTLGTENLCPTKALDPEMVAKISRHIPELRPPRILSDAIVHPRVWTSTKEQLRSETKGFRFFGQRFSIDGWIFDCLTAGEEDTPSPLPSTGTALFVPTVLGDQTARDFIKIWLDNCDPSFSKEDSLKFFAKLDEVKAQVRKVEDREWFSSLGSAWLRVLSRLTVSHGKEHPLYMQGTPFRVKQLESFLGSYTELKHGMLLYGKPNYAEQGGVGDEGTPPPVPRGFVEPNLFFWFEVQRLVDYTCAGFAKHGIFESELEENGRLGQFKEQVNFYTDLAKKEFTGKEITPEEYEQLRIYTLSYMAEPFDSAVYDIKDKRSALVADIQTDAKTGRILYESIGKPYVMIVLIGNENHPRLTIGAAFNHYEFTKPLANRMSDSDWQQIVYEKSEAPPTKNFWYDGLLTANAHSLAYGGKNQGLIEAIRRNNLELARDLLEKGADCNARDKWDYCTPLIVASQGGHLDFVKLLLEKGADVRSTGSGVVTPLSCAVANEHMAVAALLLQHGADINTKVFDGVPLLTYYSDRADIVRWLLQNGADVNARDSEGRTAMERAMGMGHMDVVNVLKAHGAKK
jgi:ankyrin repeat protein